MPYVFGVATSGQAQTHKDFDARVKNLSVVNLQTKNDHFLKEYPSRSLQPIWPWHTFFGTSNLPGFLLTPAPQAGRLSTGESDNYHNFHGQHHPTGLPGALALTSACRVKAPALRFSDPGVVTHDQAAVVVHVL